MRNQRDQDESEGRELHDFWGPLEAALEQVGELLTANDPTPRQFRELSPDDTRFGVRFLVGLTNFFDTLTVGSAAFSLMLARRGWYPGGNLPIGILSEAATLLSEGDEEGERILASHFEIEAGALGQSLINAHPKQAAAIEQTLEAHEAGNYWLTVPSLLILAEAIAKDHGMPSPYSKAEGEKLILKVLEARENFQVAVAFMAPLLVSVPIDWSPDQRATYGNPILNRHLILHGESRDYGTRLNSLRTLSHLLYVSDVLRGFPLP